LTTSSLVTLPDSRARQAKKVTRIGTPYGKLNHVPVYCANCGALCLWVTEENCTFMFYLCEGPETKNCAAKWAELAGTLAVPDEIFFEKVKQAQIEEFGRVLSAPEILEVVKDENHILSKLAKDGPGRR
jgi:hypothetical protein